MASYPKADRRKCIFPNAMGYRIQRDETLERSIRRIAQEQIDAAVDQIECQQLDFHELVHDLRKRCKKIRGLIRLARPRLEDTYAMEDAWYRDSARGLSGIRDARSMIEVFDKLVEHYRDDIERETSDSIRCRLVERNKVMQDGARIEEFRDRMCEGRRRVGGWRFKQGGSNAVLKGVRKTYARGRTAMQKACEKADSEAFHEWRKRVKYHWYHMRLLSPIWNEALKPRAKEAHRLSDYLGDDHDLSILNETLSESAAEFGECGLKTLTPLITRRQAELRMEARALGTRVFAEKPKPFRKRLGVYWSAWEGLDGRKIP